MARGTRGGRGRWLLVTAVVLVLLLIGGALLWLGRDDVDAPVDLPVPGEETPTRAQPADCPDVELISIPGTWESAVDDDPVHPQANPHALLLTVTEPLQERYDEDRLRVYTVPYVAEFRSPERPQDVSYDESRAEGTQKVRDRIASTHDHCPYTQFTLLGFSQGAVIAGDVTSEIGHGDGPVAAERVSSSIVIADGRREVGVGRSPGLPPQNGQGMEISLQPFTGLTQSIAGATMTGPRPGGFGELEDRTVDICDANDHICNAPVTIIDGLSRLGDFAANPEAHAIYASNPDVIIGTTVPEWIVDHLAGIVDDTEEVPHE